MCMEERDEDRNRRRSCQIKTEQGVKETEQHMSEVSLIFANIPVTTTATTTDLMDTLCLVHTVLQ